MVESIERNDVDISKLFTWGREVEVYDLNNVSLLKVFIRLVGDENLNRARVYALRKSAELRKKLRTENTDERLAYIPDIDLVIKENLVEQLLIYRVRDHSTRAVNELSFNIPKEPDSTASLEEMEKYQKVVDEFPKKREEQIREYITNAIERDRQKYMSYEMNVLFKEYENYLIDQLCENEMVLRFREMCVFFGTFTDKEYKNRLFKTIEEFQSVNSEIKNQLVDAYLSIEIGGEELKNLPEVVQ